MLVEVACQYYCIVQVDDVVTVDVGVDVPIWTGWLRVEDSCQRYRVEYVNRAVTVDVSWNRDEEPGIEGVVRSFCLACNSVEAG